MFDPRTLPIFSPKKLPYTLAVSAFVAIALIPSFYFYTQYQKTQERLTNPTKAAQAEAKELVGKIGKLIELPKGETPTLATVSDITKLQGQAFFAHAQNGDKVLIYGNAKQAFLFRPSTGKLINVGPINVNDATAVQPTAAPSATPTPTPAAAKPKVIIWNGTSTIGLTNTAEKTLQDKGVAVEILDKDNSEEKYDETVVVDLSGTKKDAAQAIAKAVSGTVGALPAGETKPKDAEILIILGTSFTK